ncbi:MAG: tRNA (adenosine(37)-N6)-threonylcarbamoyltransferase complex transferase subunit TsaD [Phycisphaerae bacterium]|nr:tRNA (adenosine(37)-N6)-threonylcarbamoyltransferase complex transferase subunit TsaD [Phycisphaerae bacterium]
MLVLGVESSCDETAAGVVADGFSVRSNVVASQMDVHAEYAGVVPELASRAHEEKMLGVVDEALRLAGCRPRDVDAIAIGHRPGLIGSLLVGLAAGKAVAWALDRPLIGVDHVHAHLISGLLPEAGAAPGGVEAGFPALGLVVSGGHTAIYRLDGWLAIRRLGGTIDDAAGEAFDKAATVIGLAFPGGAGIDRLGSRPGADDHAVEFPISRIAPDSLDLSFSGLKTAFLYAARGVPGPGGVYQRDGASLSEERKSDLAASFQRAVCRAIVLKLERALDRLAEPGGPAVSTLLTGGGVTANTRLRAELAALAARRRIALRLPRPEYCGDNAAMIASLGWQALRAGRRDAIDLRAEPTTAC